MTPPLFWLFWTVLVKIGLRFWIKLRFRSLGLIFKSLGLIYGPNYICIYATMFLGCLGLLWNFQRKKLRKKMNRPLLEPQLKSLNPFLQFRRPIFQGLILMAQNFIVLTHLNIKFCIIQATYIFLVYHYCLQGDCLVSLIPTQSLQSSSLVLSTSPVSTSPSFVHLWIKIALNQNGIGS